MTDAPTADAPPAEAITATSTALARVPVQSSLTNDHRYMDRLPAMAREFAQSSMCPDTWRVKPIPANASDTAQALLLAENERKVADLAIIGQSLAELDLRLSFNVLPQVYVVHGRPGYMAQLQVMLAARFGVPLVPLDEESNDTIGVCKIVGKDRQWHRVAVTIEQAKTAKWVEKNPNYRSMPDRMLMARACTKAISLHCPEAKLMLPPADRDDLEVVDVLDIPDDETGELVRIASAKGTLLEAVMRSAPDLERPAAAVTASMLWESHGLPSGEGSVPRSQVDQLLAKIPSAPQARQSPSEPPQAAPRPAGDREPRDPAVEAHSDAEAIPERIRDGQPEAGAYEEQPLYAEDEEPF